MFYFLKRSSTLRTNKNISCGTRLRTQWGGGWVNERTLCLPHALQSHMAMLLYIPFTYSASGAVVSRTIRGCPPKRANNIPPTDCDIITFCTSTNNMFNCKHFILRVWDLAKNRHRWRKVEVIACSVSDLLYCSRKYPYSPTELFCCCCRCCCCFAPLHPQGNSSLALPFFEKVWLLKPSHPHPI